MDKNTNIQYLKGVGEKRAKILNKLGIFTVGDLLRFYPRDYMDWSKISSIAAAPFDTNCCVRAIVNHKPSGAKIRKGMTIYKTVATDGESLMNITIFNNKYAAESLEAGKEYLFYGKVGGNFYRREMSSPLIAPVETGIRIHPIYHQSAGINSKAIEKLVRQAYSQKNDYFIDCIPQSLRDKLCLMEINKAIYELHFPTNEDTVSEARRRLIFEELFIFQLGLMKLKGNRKESTPVRISEDFTDEFVKSLPFTLTGAQKRAVCDSISQMTSNFTMNRLLQGDVGSGKTAVAAALIYTVAKNGYQSAFMAPTEILAQQHYKTCLKFFENTDINVALLTGSVTAAKKREIKAQIKSGEVTLIVGTHALIQDDVEFYKLGLVITDEQHRFGVKHRGALSNKGNRPHTLVMSATPIPRTLALMLYGDLDVSILDELPPGRQPIETYAIDTAKRHRAFNYVKKHLDEGRQGYIVCPLVEEGESDLAAAQEYSENISKGFFSDYTVGLLHGKMKPKDKEDVMARFVSGEIKLLVSTTVIEVGVDVPNSVIMVIENAERFGLSQLHQLRGRIGRGQHKSTCILITDAQNEATQRRMKVMTSTTDGFKIADEDLKMRGPGDFFGSRQHGLPEMKIAMLTDTAILNEANHFARELIIDDPNFEKEENSNLRQAIADLFSGEYVMN
ncbi:MAG: ATP-dependent DNA helicase RecG [Acutalibacteraceae bacterium]|nr:ATP-dependent DNA helicase RecG [Acutalibacteraceae bacterium]